MSRSLDQSRPLRAARHRAEPAASTTPRPEAEAPTLTAAIPILPIPEEPAPTTAVPVVPVPEEPAPTEPAPDSPPTSRRAARRRAASTSATVAFSSQPQAVLRKAAAVRLMSHKMAVVAGTAAVLLGVGTASQATMLPFFGQQSSAQEHAGEHTGNATPEARPSFSAGARPTSLPSAAGNPTEVPAATATDAPAGGGAPGVKVPELIASTQDLPLNFPALIQAVPSAPTAVPGASAATPSAAVAAPAVAAAPATAASAPSAATSPSAPSSPAPTTPSTSPTSTPLVSPLTSSTAAPSPQATVDAQGYANTRLTAYGWDHEQLDALAALWGDADWRPTEVDSALSYIKQRYGSPAEALKFRGANRWY